MTTPQDRPQVDPECFSAQPSAKRAEALHASYRALMQRYLVRAIQSAAEGLNADLSHISARFERLTPEQRLSPAIYMGLSGLTHALREGKITQVIDVLQEIRSTPDEVFFDARFRIDSVLSEHWEKPFIFTTREDEIDGREEEQKILRPILDPDLAGLDGQVREALQALKEADPEMAAEFDEYVARVKLFDGVGYLGFSSPTTFGAIFIRVPDSNPTEYYLEHLVHEMSHLALNTIMAHDPLMENPDDTSESPLRSDPRPLFQILHATYVLSRNIRVARLLEHVYPNKGYERMHDGFRQKYSAGYRVIAEHAKLTPLGQALFDGGLDFRWDAKATDDFFAGAQLQGFAHVSIFRIDHDEGQIRVTLIEHEDAFLLQKTRRDVGVRRRRIRKFLFRYETHAELLRQALGYVVFGHQAQFDENRADALPLHLFLLQM